VYRRLIEAGMEHKVASIEEAIELLRFQRETWTMVLDQIGKDKASKAIASINVPAPDARMEASISMSA
jgi:flagellin-specific chaperone FliS